MFEYTIYLWITKHCVSNCGVHTTAHHGRMNDVVRRVLLHLLSPFAFRSLTWVCWRIPASSLNSVFSLKLGGWSARPPQFCVSSVHQPLALVHVLKQSVTDCRLSACVEALLSQPPRAVVPSNKGHIRSALAAIERKGEVGMDEMWNKDHLPPCTLITLLPWPRLPLELLGLAQRSDIIYI